MSDMYKQLLSLLNFMMNGVTLPHWACPFIIMFSHPEYYDQIQYFIVSQILQMFLFDLIALKEMIKILVGYP